MINSRDILGNDSNIPTGIMTKDESEGINGNRPVVRYDIPLPTEELVSSVLNQNVYDVIGINDSGFLEYEISKKTIDGSNVAHREINIHEFSNMLKLWLHISISLHLRIEYRPKDVLVRLYRMDTDRFFTRETELESCIEAGHWILDEWEHSKTHGV